MHARDHISYDLPPVRRARRLMALVEWLPLPRLWKRRLHLRLGVRATNAARFHHTRAPRD